MKDPKEKKGFWTKKTWAQKTTKMFLFSEGLVHRLCEKMEIFNFKFLCKMDQGKVFCEGSEGKETFLDHKSIGLKSHQNLHFFKGVSPWFLSKNGDFLILSFYAKWIKKKCFLKVPKQKKPF